MSLYTAPDFVANMAAGLLATAAVPLNPAPERQVLAFGKEPAWDCSMLAVTLNSVRPGTVRTRGALKMMVDDAGPIEPVGVTPFVVFSITLIRCGDPSVDGIMKPRYPTVDEVNAWGTQMNTDAWALWYGLVNAHHKGILFGALPEVKPLCAMTNIGEAAPLGPKGAFGGWRILITTNLA